MYIAIAAAAVLGALVGEQIRRQVARLAYRLSDPDVAAYIPQNGSIGETLNAVEKVAEVDLPKPGPRYWMTVVLGFAWAGIVWATWPTWIAMVWWMVISSIGLYLAAVDLDVERLPDRAQVYLAGAAVVGGVILAWGEPQRMLRALIAAGLCGAAFWAIHIISKGAMGFGDVKLVTTCGWILGLSSWQTLFAGLMTGCILALGYALITRSRAFAFGPWLLAGTVLAGVGFGTF